MSLNFKENFLNYNRNKNKMYKMDNRIHIQIIKIKIYLSIKCHNYKIKFLIMINSDTMYHTKSKSEKAQTNALNYKIHLIITLIL